MDIQGIRQGEVLETKRIEQKKVDVKKEEEVKEFKEATRERVTNRFNDMRIEHKEKQIKNESEAKEYVKEIKKGLSESRSLRVHEKLDEIRDKALSDLS